MIRFTLLILLLAAFARLAAAGALAEFKDSGRDATEALQKLIQESDGLVELPPGTYRIGKPLLVNMAEWGYRGIRGANGATRLVMAGPGPAIKVVGRHTGTAAPASYDANVLEKERFPVISGFEIVGEHAEADGIQLFQTMKCTIQNMLMRRCRYGIHLIERNRNFLLADSHVYDGLDTGVFFENCNMHQANIVGNHISYNKRAGIRQFDGQLHNIQVTGNDIEYNWGGEGTSGEIVVEGPNAVSSEWTIASNTIQARPESSGANILILGNKADGTNSARIMAITGNIIGSRDENIRIERAMKVTIAGNSIYGGASLNVHIVDGEDVALADNTVGTRPWIADNSGKYVDGIVFEACRNSSISGNILHKLRAGTADAGGAVLLRDCVFTRVSDCQIMDAPVRGVHVVQGEACVVRGNGIATGKDATMIAAIEVSGTAHSVRDNDIWSSLDGPIRIHEGAGVATGNTTHAAIAQPNRTETDLNTE